MKSYGQYCPIARASEILAQRWTPILVRELLHGPATYSRLAEGAAGISRTLLTSRLRELQRAGLVEKVTADGGRQLYGLTPAGQDLGGVLEGIGSWGERWLDVTPRQADPGYTLNSWINTYLAIDRLPDRRVVVRFDFSDQPAKSGPLWVLFDGEQSEVCRRFPGFEEDLVIEAESVALAEWHLGRTEWADALAGERIRVNGNRSLARALPTWNRRSQWVEAEHPQGGPG